MDFDEQFLIENGLADLPHKAEFLQHLEEEHETRVGETIAEGLAPEVVAEFDELVAGNTDAINAFIAKNNYQTDPIYAKMSEKLALPAGDPTLNDEYASVKWLLIHRPDYEQIVAKTANDIKQEVIASRAQLLGQQ
ncbi:MAG: hypothetical protein LBM12_01630 [Candidatus Nomurabacteria bacterium]|jgi:hypothetical protein|nr:hypothetical protein [Candidatus Nomurabacteria bacterium]